MEAQILGMSPEIFGRLGAGLVMGIAALGAALGMSTAGAAAVGAAKRCYKANKPVPMIPMIIFAGFPLTGVFYGFILMGQMLAVSISAANAGLMFGFGVGAGLAIALAMIAEGKVGAAACDAISDTGKGLVLYMSILGIIETVALFAMVFTMINLG